MCAVLFQLDDLNIMKQPNTGRVWTKIVIGLDYMYYANILHFGEQITQKKNSTFLFLLKFIDFCFEKLKLAAFN